MPTSDDTKGNRRLPAALANTKHAENTLASASTLYTPENEKFDIPPPDGGTKAYLFMLTAFIIEAVMWGFPLTSSGVFTSYYNKQDNFASNAYIAVIGTLGTGIPFLGAPIITPFCARFHRYQRQMIWTGWIMCMASLTAASFSTTIWQLIITQGLGYGAGFLILYYALLSMLNEWFVERRGLAYGALFAAAGLSGTGLPFLIDVCLNRFGYPLTLRGYAVAILVLVGPTLPFCRGRLPSPSNPQFSKIQFLSVFKNPIFYFFSLSNIFQGLAFYLPGLFLTIYAETLGISPLNGVVLLCVLNLAMVVGQIATGWLSDCANIFILLLVSTLGSAVLGCVLWYIAKDMLYLIFFAILFGVFAGGYTVMYTRFCSACTDDPATTLWLYGIFAFERGIGIVAAGPLAAELLHFIDRKLHVEASPQGYRTLILFVGVCLLVSAVGSFGYFWRHRALGLANKPCKIRPRKSQIRLQAQAQTF
ncbi:MFS general substrate transporter [Microthyrium microscopicum]|uniref:MFS general substrate transporter n=1 Tax=Microthyrium microscopicum TaxID=703497 RepID=A0A6A6UA22_9PEZI|nr:MFS general substrate transporter [Microthyrium microscopicum]